ncbi:hypothetical protein [Fructobacillus durionis]|uniref:DNA-directed RNA polymerase beta subunit n=1 Tax=Fructobacillus durionis TaxID=283737 RepID=A0A1I1EF95_9LACO|nr:hypothetical protein [Fructobacillus durionis]SFB85829.1 hypothetical protein SAMN05660453_0456 [Fructobacillus durionis]
MNKDFLEGEDWLAMVQQYFEKDYRERGKVKWNGFFLSDHTAKLKSKSQNEKVANQAVWLSKRSLEQIQQSVHLAYEHASLLILQKNQVDCDNRIPLPVAGRVRDFYAEGFYLGDEAIDWTEVRYAEVKNGKSRINY